MKKIIFISFVLSGLLLSACSKDKMKTRKIEGKWELKKCNVDGIGRLISNEYFSQIIFEFDGDGDFTSTWQRDDEGLTDTPIKRGTWEIDDGELDMTYFDNSFINEYVGNPTGVREIYDIREFSKEAFTLETVINGKTVKIEAERKN